MNIERTLEGCLRGMGENDYDCTKEKSTIMENSIQSYSQESMMSNIIKKFQEIRTVCIENNCENRFHKVDLIFCILENCFKHFVYYFNNIGFITKVNFLAIKILI